MKNFAAVLFALLSLNAFSQIPDYVPTDGLVGCWLLDGNGNDESGFSHHGQNFGATATTNRWGEEEKAFYFNSQSYLVVNHTDELNIPTGSDLTWSIWMRPEPDNEGGSAFEKWAGSDSQNRSQLILRINDNADYFTCKAWCNYTTVAPVDAEVIPNEWHHVLLRTSDQHSELFVNGILVDSSDVELLGCTNSTNLFIGKRNALSGNTRAFKGAIDDFGIWNRALTDEEITALFEVAQPVLGCTDSDACNFNAEATEDDGSCVYSGCNDPSACNFNGADICDIDCIYPAIGEDCTAGEGLCGPGTYWDDASQTCRVTIPGDVDFNGCLSIEDLLGSLAIYNLCFDAEAIAFTCGVDVVHYDGYDYQTVQIGDQCWFVENCKHLPEVSPGDNGSEDVALEPHAYVYGYNGTDVEEAKTFSDRYDIYGVLYNHFAAEAWQLCPSGWHKALAQDFRDLEVNLGLPEELVATGGGSNGTDIGIKLKAVGFGNGTNSSGFTFLGAGYREVSGNFHSLNSSGHMRAFAVDQSIPPNGSGIEMNAGWTGAGRMNTYVNKGFSVRCVKDSE